MSTTKDKSVSYGYEKISEPKAKKLVGAWLNKSLPESQWQIVAPILKRKIVPEVAEPVIEILRNLGADKLKLLDVGCSSGYYYDFFRWSKFNIDYRGCDVSPHFISLAKKKYPKISFDVAPMAHLPYETDSFDIVLASGVLHYDLDYERTTAELIRVSKRYVLLHRLPTFPVKSNSRLSYYKKIGYGVEMMEVIFDFKTLNRLFKKLGLLVKRLQNVSRVDIDKKAYWSTILLEKLPTKMTVINAPIALSQVIGKSGYPKKRKVSRGKKLLAKIDPSVLNNDLAIKENVDFIRGVSRRLSRCINGRLLDLGCGGGDYYQIFKLAKLPLAKMDYYGCEINDNIIKTAQIRYPEAKFFNSQAQKIASGSNHYDIVFASGVIQYTLQDLGVSLREMARVGSKYIIITRLPLTSKRTYYMKQTVSSVNGTEIRYFAVTNTKVFSGLIRNLGLKVISEKMIKEGNLSVFQFLLKLS